MTTRAALVVLGIMLVAGCSNGKQAVPAAFCQAAHDIQRANTNAAATTRQQALQRAIVQAEQLGAVATPKVRSALQTLVQTLEPLASGVAVAMTPSDAAASRVRQATATATVDKALRDSCGLDISVLGQTTNLSSSPHTS